MQEWRQELETSDTIGEDEYTRSIPDLHELHNIVKNMRSNATPGPDGLSVDFYKSAWQWVGKDVLDLVTKFY